MSIFVHRDEKKNILYILNIYKDYIKIGLGEEKNGL